MFGFGRVGHKQRNVREKKDKKKFSLFSDVDVAEKISSSKKRRKPRRRDLLKEHEEWLSQKEDEETPPIVEYPTSNAKIPEHVKALFAIRRVLHNLKQTVPHRKNTIIAWEFLPRLSGANGNPIVTLRIKISAQKESAKATLHRYLNYYSGSWHAFDREVADWKENEETAISEYLQKELLETISFLESNT